MRLIAVVPAVALLSGATAGLILGEVPWSVGTIALVAASGTAGWALGARRPAVLVVAAPLGFFGGGAMLTASAWQRAWCPPLRVAYERFAAGGGAAVVLTGVLRADAMPRTSGVSLSVEVTSVRHVPTGPATGPTPHDVPGEVQVHGGVLITVGGELARTRLSEWRAGRTIRVPVYLRRPARYLNPGAPDEERSLARRGATLVGSAKSGALVEIVGRGSRPAEAAGRARAYVRRVVQRSVGRWSARSAGIVTAILIGDRAGLDDEVERRLQEAGTFHVIAISGGNIAILAGIMLTLFRLAGTLGRAATLSAMAVLISYAYLVGGGASVNRATFMAVLYLTGRLMDLRGPPWNVLAVAAALLVTLHPLSVAEPGFLLTFGATIAIIFVVPLTMRAPLPPAVAPVVATMAASLAAELMLFPVGASLFSRVTFAGIVLNLAAVPAMAIVQIAGMTVVLLSLIAPLPATVAGWVAHVAAEVLVQSGGLVHLVPFVTWRVAPPSWLVLATYYTAIVLAALIWSRPRRTTGQRSRAARVAFRTAMALAGGSALWILVQPWTFASNRPDGSLRVVFLDVGQGDATFVRFPSGQTLLVDAGGLPSGSSYDVGDRVVAPVLRFWGIRRLNTLALTHGDVDHIGGAPSVVSEFQPAEIWEGIPVPRLRLLRHIRTLGEDIGARWTNLQSGDRMAVGDVDVLVHHPALPDWERQDPRNDDSLVIELRRHDVSIVLAGDIGHAVESELADRIAASRVRVLKVPHHGSATSSGYQFVRALAPRVAVVSAGRANTFGHPVPAVLDRYRSIGASIFRTDEDGAISVETDGRRIAVSTFSGRSEVFE